MDNPTTLDTYIKEKKDVLNDHFWSDDPHILLSSDRALEFVPTQDMTVNERLNAISRFFIYFGVLLFLIFHNYLLFFVPIIGLFFLWMIFYNDKQLHAINVEKFDQDIKKTFNLPKDLSIGIDDQGNICQRPTMHNPFMNVLISDYTTCPNRPPPCLANDPDVKDEIDKGFYYNLYRDVSDVYEKSNSQRQYVTLPGQTIPNDRDSFQRWANLSRGVCKDGQNQFCLPFEDMRIPGYS